MATLNVIDLINGAETQLLKIHPNTQTEKSALAVAHSNLEMAKKMLAPPPVVVPPVDPPVVTPPIVIPPIDPPPVVTPPPSSGLVQLSDFAAWHKGAFSLPAGKFEYARRGLALSPDAKSLYVSNIDTGKQCSQVTIPANLTGTAALIAGPVDPCEGKIQSIGGDPPAYLGGYWARQDGSLIVSAYGWYDGSNTQSKAFFTRPQNLSDHGHVAGAFPAVGAPAPRFAGGYFAAIPAAWQAAFGGDLLAGLCCTNIISGTSYGPCVGVMQAADVGVNNKWKGAVYYTESHPLHNVWNTTSDIFNGTTEITGVVFVKDSVIFIGRQGTGHYFYGQPPQDGADPVDGNKGNHAYPYRSQVWLYDAHDLAAVLAGSKQPYDVQPYAYGPLGGITQKPWGRMIGAAYDAASGKLYLGQGFATGYQDTEPLVHVYQVA